MVWIGNGGSPVYLSRGGALYRLDRRTGVASRFRDANPRAFGLVAPFVMTPDERQYAWGEEPGLRSDLYFVRGLR